MIVDCALYRDGRRQHAGPLALDRAAQMCGETDGFVWVGLFEPEPEELADVQDRFGLHELAIEDAQNFHLRPKIERYEEGDVLFAVLRTARYDEERGGRAECSAAPVVFSMNAPSRRRTRGENSEDHSPESECRPPQIAASELSANPPRPPVFRDEPDGCHE